MESYIKGIKKGDITSGMIKASPETYYGKTVGGLTLNNGDTTKFKVFYADDNNIYLIAGDQVKLNRPENKAITDVLTKSSDTSDYLYNFTNTLSTAPYSAGATSITGIGKTLLNTFITAYPNSTNNNMKATAMMLDTDLWNVYTDSNETTSYVEYAIGGPTLEMFVESYNAYQGEEKLFTAIDNAKGYHVGTTPNPTTNSTGSGSVQGGLYVLSGKHYWLASPSAYNGRNVCYVLSGGDVSSPNGYDAANVGFRPLVCLKSGVKLTAVGVSEGFDLTISK